MHLFYTPGLNGETHELDEQESKHAVRVLRLSKGDAVVCVDGTGGWYEAVILDDHPKRCVLEVGNHISAYKPLPYHLHIAISPTKSLDRFEWFLEKATEIGITRITPLMCHRTERKQVKMERLEKIIVSAMKQSLKAYMPHLSQPVSLDGFLMRRFDGALGIAHCHPTNRSDLAAIDPAGSYTMLIGPEGDFTEEEVRRAVKAGFLPFDLGESRLRTETAGIHICSAIQILERKDSNTKRTNFDPQ